MGYDESYRAGGFGYDNNIDRWRRWVADHYVSEFHLQPGTRLLDVGCGDGFWSMLLAEHGIHVAGVDASEGGIEVAQQRHRVAFPDKAFEFVVADLRKPLPFPRQSFDVAFMRGLTQLFGVPNPLDHAAVLSNIAAAVRPGGMLLMSIWSKQTGHAPEGSEIISHKASVYAAALETVAKVVKLSAVGDYLQIGAITPD